MTAKKLVQDFYKSDALIDAAIMNDYLHPEFILEWNSSTGFIKMNREDILNLTDKLNKAYVRSKVRISHFVNDGSTVAIRYAHYVKTIENPREEMHLADFFIIWEIKDGKLYRGYQMSQPA